jgi:hypothetical protein
MWLFLPEGLIMPSEFPREKADPAFMDEAGLFDIQVRARTKSHLENFLRDRVDPFDLPHSAIQATPGMDYNFRFYIARKDLAVAVADAVLSLNYRKFKPTAEDRYEDGTPMYAEGREYHSVLNSIWGTVCRLGSPGGSWSVRSDINPAGYTPRTSYTDWWKDRLGRHGERTTRFTEDDDWPDTRYATDRASRWLVDDSYNEDLDDYLPDSEERRLDALLDVNGIPASQWDEYLTPEQLALVKDDREEKVSQERRERKPRFRGRRKSHAV